jgi:hypothetical protein
LGRQKGGKKMNCTAQHVVCTRDQLQYSIRKATAPALLPAVNALRTAFCELAHCQLLRLTAAAIDEATGIICMAVRQPHAQTAATRPAAFPLLLSCWFAAVALMYEEDV